MVGGEGVDCQGDCEVMGGVCDWQVGFEGDVQLGGVERRHVEVPHTFLHLLEPE